MDSGYVHCRLKNYAYVLSIDILIKSICHDIRVYITNHVPLFSKGSIKIQKKSTLIVCYITIWGNQNKSSPELMIKICLYLDHAYMVDKLTTFSAHSMYQLTP